jgi:hypothetical protein
LPTKVSLLSFQTDLEWSGCSFGTISLHHATRTISLVDVRYSPESAHSLRRE